jgi:hypothetical protein
MERPQQPLSALERLPVEIIQTIFFDTLEVNLANSSPSLNRALSQQSIYTSLLLFAFFDDDGLRPVEVKHFLPAKYRRLSVADRLRLQVQILECRWCTPDRIRSCIPTLSRLTMIQAWYRERDDEQKIIQDMVLDLEHPGKDLPPVMEPQHLGIAALPDIDDQVALHNHFSATFSSTYYALSQHGESAIGPIGPGGFLPFILCWTYDGPNKYKTGEAVLGKELGFGKAVLGPILIPDRMLQGSPWTQEKLSILQLFSQSLRFAHCSDCDYLIIKEPAMLKGIESAITECDLAMAVEALTTLLDLHVQVASLYLDVSELRDFYEKPAGYPRTHDPSWEVLPLRLFHLATKRDHGSSEILTLLIRASWSSIPSDDHILTAWALRSQERGEPIGKWLNQYMERWHEYNIDITPALSFKGAMLCDDAWPFPKRTFDSDVGYIVDFVWERPMRRWGG